MTAPAILTSCSLFLSFLLPVFAKAEFVHPGILHSQSSLDFVRAQIAAEKEPWHGAWQGLADSLYTRANWQPSARAHVERGPYNRPDIGSRDFTNDGRSAYSNALHWALSHDHERAQNAAEILDAWSATLETVSNHDARLLIGISGLHYLAAAELLTHTWDGWPQEKQAQFAKMVRAVWYPIIKDFHPTANGNWDAAMLQTMIAMGVYLDDQAIFARAVSYYRAGEGNGAVANYFHESGQCQESGRDQNHTQMGLEFLANTCETAWVQGLDLYSAHDNRLLKGFEYTAQYNLGNEVPYVPYKSFQGRYHYKEISEIRRGELRKMYQKAAHHYHHRKGLPAPYTRQAALKNRPQKENESKDRSLPWSRLMHAQLPD